VPIGHLAARLHQADTLRPVRTAELESMYVLADARDRGAGGELVGRFLERARGRGAQRVAVTAYAANDRAMRFYRRCGIAPKSLTLDAAL
jgi:GNAT superfamily N-acetyltransferase